jgi:hypothetical protein
MALDAECGDLSITTCRVHALRQQQARRMPHVVEALARQASIRNAA